MQFMPSSFAHIRSDSMGSGHYLASRGRRKHRGVDFDVNKDTEILAVAAGIVTKLGYPYSPGDLKKGHLRYVEVTTHDLHRTRYFYCKPVCAIGDEILKRTPIGLQQDLQAVYGTNMDNHLHFEVIDRLDTVLDPIAYLKTQEKGNK